MLYAFKVNLTFSVLRDCQANFRVSKLYLCMGLHRKIWAHVEILYVNSLLNEKNLFKCLLYFIQHFNAGILRRENFLHDTTHELFSPLPECKAHEGRDNIYLIHHCILAAKSVPDAHSHIQ